MRLVGIAFVCALTLSAAIASALADIVVTIDKSTQRLSVAVDGTVRYRWPTSTARRGYVTPNGSYKPEWLARSWFSRKYDNSPMPYSIFFHGGYAIHGSYETGMLGRPASHGCVRLHPSHARILFELVQARPLNDTTIIVTDSPQSRAPRQEARQQAPPENSCS